MNARKRRVMIVDDTVEQRDVYAAYLSFHGFETVGVGDAEEALRVAPEARPDVVIMDVRLPGMDGWSATERLKMDPMTADIPVLILTGRARGEDRHRSAAVGADAYLAKPCELEQVLRWVELLIRAASEGLEAPRRPVATGST